MNWTHDTQLLLFNRCNFMFQRKKIASVSKVDVMLPVTLLSIPPFSSSNWKIKTALLFSWYCCSTVIEGMFDVWHVLVFDTNTTPIHVITLNYVSNYFRCWCVGVQCLPSIIDIKASRWEYTNHILEPF